MWVLERCHPCEFPARRKLQSEKLAIVLSIVRDYRNYFLFADDPLRVFGDTSKMGRLSN